jgi:hypothetical protein
VVLLAHHPHAGGRAQLVATREGEVDAASALVVGGGTFLVEAVARAFAHAQHLVGVRARAGVRVRVKVRVAHAQHRYCELVDLLRDEELLL